MEDVTETQAVDAGGETKAYTLTNIKLTLPPVPQTPATPENETPVDSDTLSVRSTRSRRSSYSVAIRGPPPVPRLLFHTSLVYVFIVGMVACIAVLIAQLVLLGIIINNPSSPEYNTAFSKWTIIFNVITTAWFAFGIFYGSSYAPSVRIVAICIGLTSFAGFLGCAVAYIAYGVLAMLVYLIPSIGFMLVLPLSPLIYSTISTLPVQELALQAWLTSFRYFAIVSAPIIIIYIKTGPDSLLSFFSIVVFCLAVSAFNTIVRVNLCLSPFTPDGVSTLFGQLSIAQLVAAYGPSFTLLIIFAILYVLELSGIAVSPALVVVLLAISAFLLLSQAVFNFAFISRWPILRFINPFTSEDYSILDAARIKERAIHDLGITASLFHGPQATLRQRREDLQQQLQHVETKLATLSPGVSFNDVMVYVFFAVTVACIPILLSEVILLGQGHLDFVKTTPFFIFNLLATAWMIFGLIICVSYAPNSRIIWLSFGFFMVAFVLLAVWANFVFGTIASVVFAVFAVAVFAAIPIGERIYKQVSCLPVEDNTMNQWFTSWRFFAVIAGPVVARFISSGTASQVSFFAIMIFTLGLSMYCGILRVHFAVRPPIKRGGVAALFQQIHIAQLVKLYLPVVVLMLLFAILYLIDSSNNGFTIADSAIVIILLIAAACLLMFFVWLHAFCRFSLFQGVNPFSKDDYNAVDSSLEYARKIREIRSAPEEQLSQLRLQRKSLRRQLNEAEADVIASANATKGVSIAIMIVYGYTIGLCIFIPVWIAQVILIWTGQIQVILVTGFWIFNIASASFFIFGIFFVVLFSPSALFLLINCILTCIAAALVAIWAYYVFGVPSMLFFFLTCGAFGFAAVLSKRVFLMVCLLPIEDLSIQVFFTSLRFLLLLLTPIVVSYVQTGQGSQVSFFSVVFFSASTMYLTATVRVFAAIHPASRTVSALIRQHSTRQMLQHFVPFFVMLIVFFLLYVIDVSGVVVSTTIVYTLVIIGVVLLGVLIINVMAFIIRSHFLALFNLYTDEDYDWLDAARARNRDIISRPRRSASTAALPSQEDDVGL